MSHYTVIESNENLTTVDVEGVAFQVSPSALAMIDLAIAGGGNALDVFTAMTGLKASSAKPYDAEKARRKAERAKVAKEVERLKTDLEGIKWSTKVVKLAKALSKARGILSDLEEIPVVVSLADYEEVTHNALEGQWRIRMATRGGQQVTLLEVGLSDTLPLVAARNDVAALASKFRLAASEQVGEVVPESLQSHVKSMIADVGPDGSIGFSYTVKGTGGGGKGGGKRRKVEYQGTVYDSLSELGKVVNPTVKYPHKTGAALVSRGEAQFVS